MKKTSQNAKHGHFVFTGRAHMQKYVYSFALFSATVDLFMEKPV